MTDDPWAERAEAAWHALASCLARAPNHQLVVKDGPARGAPGAALWPFGQVLTAAIALLRTGVVDESEVIRPLLSTLERYRHGDGYGPFPGDRTRYFDDNAWIALAVVQLALVTGDDHHLGAARSLFAFLEEGEVPGGGVLWVEGQESRNTCSTGPSAQVALRLHLATGDERPLAFAQRQLAFLDNTLRTAEGLFRDNVDGHGRIEPTIWSYNQGTPIGAMVLMSRLTGDRRWRDDALRTARATEAHFAVDDGWWRQPPVFNAIYFRNLLALAAHLRDRSLLVSLDAYLDRVWIEARDPRSGLFVGAGIGSYDGRPTIDQAGLNQLLAFRAWPTEVWTSVC
jgi:hypothetical protein